MKFDKTTIFLTLSITSIIYFFFLLMEIKSISNKKLSASGFIIKVNDNKELYVIESKDKSLLVLGNNTTYNESDEIFLYDINTKNMIEFKKINTKNNEE